MACCASLHFTIPYQKRKERFGIEGTETVCQTQVNRWTRVTRIYLLIRMVFSRAVMFGAEQIPLTAVVNLAGMV